MRDERGVMLLDAMLALAILSSAVVALVSLGAAAEAELSRSHAKELEMADAHRLLGALSLLTPQEYDQRLGARTIGPYLVEVIRPERGLYRVSVKMTESPTTELLTTVVFRPDSAS